MGGASVCDPLPCVSDFFCDSLPSVKDVMPGMAPLLRQLPDTFWELILDVVEIKINNMLRCC